MWVPYAEYFVKMEMTMYCFQVDGTEVDDHGIDFVARHEEGPFPEAQEKSTRSVGYVFIIILEIGHFCGYEGSRVC